LWSGGSVSVTVPRRSQTGRTLRLRGLGAPRRSGDKGDLLIRLSVRAPDADDPELDRLAKEISRFYRQPVRAGLRL
ncbi:MAG: hypothetical protein D6776_09635, partial [Planctomycetota bacterium]